MLIIMPIILKFLPLFLLFFYWFGIIGMEAFYTTYTNGITTAYNFYDPVGHFRSFLYTQFVMIQVLTEAGWSMIAFDHAGRNANNYGFVMLFFCLMHITIVYMIAALIKGIFWEVYFTVNGQLETRTQKETEAKEQEKIYE